MQADIAGGERQSMNRCSPGPVRFVCRNLDHTEGLCLAEDGALFAGGEAGQIYRIDEASRNAEVVADTGGFVLGLCADLSGAIYACDAGRNQVLRIGAGGEVESLSTGALDNPNDCALDPLGNLFFTESGSFRPERRTGRLHVIKAGGETRCIHPGPFRFANGVFFDSGSSLLYVVESNGPSVMAFQTDGPGLASMEPVRRIELEPDTVPDGVALDTAGNLYIAFYSPDQIGVVRPDGTFEVLFRDFLGEWMNRPTNMALRPNEIVFANLGGWHIGAISHELQPVRPCYPGTGPRAS